jgi:hypothetical protein
MINSETAEKALDYLRRTSVQMEGLVLEAKEAARKAKYTQALAIVRMANANTQDKVPATVRKEHSWADDEVQAAFKEEDEKAAKLIGVDAQRDAAKTAISLYQSMVKDRI